MADPIPSYRRGAAGLVRRVLVAVVLAVVLGWAALVVLAAIGAEVGTGGLLVGGVLALLPVVPVTLCFLWLDRWEPEPPAYVGLALGWGATVAAGVSLALNSLAVRVMLPVLAIAGSLAANRDRRHAIAPTPTAYPQGGGDSRASHHNIAQPLRAIYTSLKTWGLVFSWRAYS